MSVRQRSSGPPATTPSESSAAEPLAGGEALAAAPGERRRSAGVLLHVSSLPGRHGIGDLGRSAFAWVDALARAGQSWWQILPLNPPGDGVGPYQCFSAFAGNPALISPDELVKDGLLRPSDLGHETFPAGRFDHARVLPHKQRLLRKAWANFSGGAAGKAPRAAYRQFREEQAPWLDDFALFMALKENQGGKPWIQWPADLLARRPGALAAAAREGADAVGRHQFVQFLFFRQLASLREHARARGVKLIGDLPIFVAGDSADVWAHPHLFQLDARRHPKAVAGVPPDYFSKTGQRWGNPLYHWEAMRRDGFAWWVGRFRTALRQVDLVRIDHFRGFEAYWQIPARCPTAVEGRWVKAPGAELFETLREQLGGLPFIAEDLGLITPEVEALRDQLGLPGMKVLQFAFGGDADNPFLPHRYPRNAVAYTGTHDNDTTAGWLESLKQPRRKKEAAFVRRYAPGAAGDGGSSGEAVWALTRLAWASVADLAIVPLQDVLGLGSEGRMNTPGTTEGNWGWRVTAEQLKGEGLARLKELTLTYGRGGGRGTSQ